MWRAAAPPSQFAKAVALQNEVRQLRAQLGSTRCLHCGLELAAGTQQLLHVPEKSAYGQQMLAPVQTGNGWVAHGLPVAAAPLPPPRTLDPQPAISALPPRTLLGAALENHMASAPTLR